MSDRPVIEVESLTFGYDVTPVLLDVNFSIGQGDFVFMIGPNGGGKTTLLKLILGLLEPHQGTVRLFGGHPIQTRRKVGYMTQHANLDLRFPISVLSVALMGRLGQTRTLGPFRKSDYALAKEALKQVGLEGIEKRSFAALSGGQRQRLLIARALVTQPDLLLLDEPTSNLDLQGENEFMNLLKQLNEKMTVVLVSHDVGFVSAGINRVICVNRRVTTHETSQITPEILHELYGGNVQVVRHSHPHHGHAHE